MAGAASSTGNWVNCVVPPPYVRLMGVFQPETDCVPFGTNATTSVAETESSGAGRPLTVACTPPSDVGQLPSRAVAAVTGSKGPMHAPCNRILSPGAMGSWVMLVKPPIGQVLRSEEHTSELQSLRHL